MGRRILCFFYIVVAVIIIVICGALVYKADKLQEKAHDTQLLIDETLEHYEKLREEALIAYNDGYAFYLNGILVDSKNILIESLLSYNIVVSVNHEERYVELKCNK